MRRRFAAILCAAACSLAHAHGLVHERIDAVTASIALAPSDARLYLDRAELYRVDRDFDAALADYARAEALDVGLAEVDFARGKLWIDAGEWALARASLDRFLATRPDHADARARRAQVLMRLDEAAAAVDDWNHAIRLFGRGKPEHYVERARARAALGSVQIGVALIELEEGYAALGPIIALDDVAIELEARRGNWDAAIQRIDRVIRSGARRDVWLARRAAMHRAAGRDTEARDDMNAALSAFAALPEHVRRHRANVELEASLRAELSRQ